jgi:hypothetical protein
MDRVGPNAILGVLDRHPGDKEPSAHVCMHFLAMPKATVKISVEAAHPDVREWDLIA